MDIEHRLGVREAVALDVEIVCPRSGLLRGRSCNLSGSGVFVSIDAPRPAINSLVEVVIVRHGPGGPADQRLEAMVVRMTDKGVGLMFSDFNPRAIPRVLVPPSGGDVDAAAAPQASEPTHTSAESAAGKTAR